ncbi:hypothetical protein WAI453_000058 [Rhynchosporium graminicola]
MRFSILLPLITLPAAKAFGGFTRSCTGIAFNQPFLSANCVDYSRKRQHSQVNLSHWVENRGGNLVWATNTGESFAHCSCHLDTSKIGILDCQCPNSNGGSTRSRLNLGPHCDNQNGYLTCDSLN